MKIGLGLGLTNQRSAETGPATGVPVSFGALTLAGAGGVAKPAGAASISNAGGTNLVLTSGFAVPDTGGTVTSGTVTWNDGTTWTVTAVADTYSALADKTEIEAAHAAASLSATTTCLVREGSTTDTIDLTGRDFTGSFTLKGSGFSTNSATRPNGYTWGSAVGNILVEGNKIRIEELEVYSDFSASKEAVIYQPSGTIADLIIRKCHIHGEPLENFFDDLIAEGGTGSTTIATIIGGVVLNIGVDTVLIEDNYIHDANGAISTRGDNVTSQGNYSEDTIAGWIGTLPGDNINILNNEHRGLWGSVEDPGDVHGGMGGGTILSVTPASNGTVKGNVVLLGDPRQLYEESRGRHLVTAIDMTGITGFKLNDANADTESYDTWDVSHNIFQLANGTGINIENAINIDIHHNTLVGVRGTTDDPIDWGGQPGFNFEETGTFAMTGNKVRHNICAPDQGLNDIIAQMPTFQLYENISLLNSAAITTGATVQRTYDEYLVGDATKDFGADLTTAEAILAFAPKTGTHADTANIGAVNDYYTIGIPGKGGSDTTPAFTRPDSTGNATATGHAYAATNWDGTYGLELDTSTTSGAFLDGASAVAAGKVGTFVFQGTFANDTDEFVLAQAVSLDIDFKRLGNGSTQLNRMYLAVDSASDVTERALVYSPIHPITNAMGRVTVAISYDLANDRVCSAVNGVPFDLSDDNDFQVADIAARMNATNVHLLESIFGASRFNGELEALIIENQFVDLTTTAGLESLFAADGHLLSPTAIDTTFGREPLVFLMGDADAFNEVSGANGNDNGRAQGVSVTNSGTVTDVDTTAPTLSSATDAANGATASTGSVSTNEGNGTLYWVVTTSATAPSPAQVKLGQDNSGSAAADSGSQAVSGTGTQTITPAPSGLTASTAYTTHFVHEDAAGNQSTVASASGFTTASGSNVDEGSSTATFTTSGGSRVAELTNGQTLVVTTGFTPSGIEMVGGGGGGGNRSGGGGGAGELIQITSSVPALTAQTYTATVGAGGTGGLTSDTANTPTSGGNTRLIGGSTDNVALTALGGGYGGSDGTTRNGVYGLAADGGSGGGSGPTGVAGRFGASTASDGVGNAGNNGSFADKAGGGGGGANAAGSAQAAGVGGAGGAGIASVTPGKADTLAAGGTGGDNITLTAGAAGTNFGDGGGGGSESFGSRDGGAGAAGIIRVWWPV